MPDSNSSPRVWSVGSSTVWHWLDWMVVAVFARFGWELGGWLVKRLPW